MHRALHRRRSPAAGDMTDFERTPGWANGALELPMHLEARAIARGHRLAAGLSVLGVFQTAPAP